MGPTTADHSNHSDDLDIALVLDRVLRFFKKYAFLLLVFTIGGLLAGLALYFVTPRQYSSKLLLHSFTFTNTEQIRIIDNWDHLVKKGECQTLADIFGASVPAVKKLAKLEAMEIQKLYIPNNPNGFMVEAKVRDIGILDSLQHWILRGLEHEPYIRSRMEVKRSNLRDLIATVQQEIQKLDSTKGRIEQSIRGSQQAAGYLLDISSINTQVISLKEKLLAYKEELKFTAPVQVLHPFEKINQPSSPRLLKLLVLGLIAGFALGYFIAIYRSLRSQIKPKP